VTAAREAHVQAAEQLALAEADLQTVTREVEAHESLGAVLTLRRTKAEEAHGEALRALQIAADRLRSAQAEAASLIDGAEAGLKAAAVELEHHAHRRPSTHGARAHERQRARLASERTRAEEAILGARSTADEIVEAAEGQRRQAAEALSETEAALASVDRDLVLHRAGLDLLEVRRHKSEEVFGQARRAFDEAHQTLRSARGREA
jgi:chromosome segregation protein